MRRASLLMGLAALLCGCDGVVPAPVKAAPAPRYVVAGIHNYPNAVSVFVLDNRAGQVCSTTFYNDGKTPTERDCGEALNPNGE